MIKTPSEPTIYDYAFSKVLAYATLQFPNYIIGRHHILIAKYLQRLELPDSDSNNIRRLAVFMPPRSGKSLLCGEMFIPWISSRNKHFNTVYASYGGMRSIDIGRSSRNYIDTDIHRKVFPDAHLSVDSKGALNYSLTNGSSAYFVGAQGALTGKTAHLLILDDLIKGAEEASSATSRDKLEEWVVTDAYTRLTATKECLDGRMLLICTRWAFDDIADFLLNQLAHENWHILNLPAIADGSPDALGREEGEALWPEKYPLKRLNTIKKSMNSHQWSALYQQRPLPKSGNIIQSDWFKRYNVSELRQFRSLALSNKEIPENIKMFNQIVISIDTAFRESELADFSAFTVWGRDRNHHYLIDVINKRLGFPDLIKMTKRLYEKYKEWRLGVVPVIVEDAASGQSLIQVLKRETRIPVIGLKPDRSKEIRLSEVSAAFESGLVYFPERASFLTETETQLLQAPLSPKMDICDSISQYLRWSYNPKRKKRKSKIWLK